MTILEREQYRDPDGRPGTYTYDGNTNTVRWISGPFADGGVTTQIFRRDDDTLVIGVAPAAADSDPRDTYTCVIQ